ncbi:DHA3 family macrolide efflux protein-like MFS transporter [Undibacterium sp. GrIS 1.2]|uniref:MFS transporter n=1 Tax=Undibacterium sp. GrIS 1.2 TaxID=3143933 RepID=UPI003392379E
MSSIFSVLREREYSKYAAASALTSVGTGMQFVAISWYLWTITHSASAIGWILILSTLPGMLFSPWIGALIDRGDARRICISADLVRCAILVALVVATYSIKTNLTIFYVSIFCIAICDNFFQPAVGAMVRSIVSREQLLSANIVGNMCMQIGVLVGAGVGGLLVAQFGAPVVLLVNAFALIISAILTSCIKTLAPRLESEFGEITKHPSFMDEFKATAKYIFQHSHIIWLANLQMFVYITLYVCNTLLAAFVDRELAAGASGFGIIDAAWGAGALLGGLSLSTIVKKIDRRLFGLLGLLLLSAAVFLFLTSHALPQAFFAYLLLGFLACTIRVNTDTILVSEVDPAYFGRVKSTITMFISYIGLALYAVVGYLGDTVAIRTIYIALGSALFLGFLVAALPRIGIRRIAQ